MMLWRGLQMASHFAPSKVFACNPGKLVLAVVVQRAFVTFEVRWWHGCEKWE